MRQLTAFEIATALNLSLNYEPNPMAPEFTEEVYILNAITKATNLPKSLIVDMTDLELAYFLNGSVENFVNLQKETVLYTQAENKEIVLH